MKGAALARALAFAAAAASNGSSSATSGSSSRGDGDRVFTAGLGTEAAVASNSTNGVGSLSQDLTARYLALASLAAMVKVSPLMLHISSLQVKVSFFEK